MNESDIRLIVGLISIIGTLIVLYVNHLNNQRKLQLEVERGLIETRLKAYKELWALMKGFSPTTNQLHQTDEWKKCHDALLDWYYKCGNGMMLSNRGVKCFDCLINSLKHMIDDEEDYIKYVVELARGFRIIVKSDLYLIDDDGEIITDRGKMEIDDLDAKKCKELNPCRVPAKVIEKLAKSSIKNTSS